MRGASRREPSSSPSSWCSAGGLWEPSNASCSRGCTRPHRARRVVQTRPRQSHASPRGLRGKTGTNRFACCVGEAECYNRVNSTSMKDQYGRPLTDLRISLTDRCNLRCVYCMPAEGIDFRPPEDLLQDDELVLLVRIAADLGVRRLRLTGGEPTVRPRVVDLVRELAAIPGIEDMAMTTNGVLLKELAAPLASAGLQRVNISLDTLDPQKFSRITRGGHVEKVLAGLAAAEAVGLTPIKLNSVVVRGFNEDDVVPLAALTLSNPWISRAVIPPARTGCRGHPGRWGSLAQSASRSARNADGCVSPPMAAYACVCCAMTKSICSPRSARGQLTRSLRRSSEPEPSAARSATP